MFKMKLLANALLVILLLTFIHPCSGKSVRETVVVFQNRKTKVQDTDSGEPKKTKTPKAFNAPSFVGGMINDKEFLAIISSARLEDSSEIEYTDGVVRTSYGNHTQWTPAEMFINVSKITDSEIAWGDTTAVMNGNKIYVLITSLEEVRFGKTPRNPLMIVGNIMKETECSIGEVCIQWKAPISLSDTVPHDIRSTRGVQFIGGEGNGIVTTNGTIIFPIVMLNNNERAASTLYSIDYGTTWLIGGETEMNAGDGSVVEWSDNKLLFIAASVDGSRKVYESDDLGITWKKSPIFFGVWGNNKNFQEPETPGSVTTVPVKDKDVLIFAFPQNNVDNAKVFDTLQLWMSDGERIACVGTISDETNETNTGHSVLAYVGENLYITHEINPPKDLYEETPHMDENWQHVIGLTPLPDVFEKVKTTALAWRKLDEVYQSKGIPTDALVGFLGNTKADNGKVWADMYNCVNATVTNGKSVDGGFCFDGRPGSGAKWPVKEQGQNQLYRFTENQFTLYATVIIHNKSGSRDVSVVGASGKVGENGFQFGLGFTENMKWYTIHKSDNEIDTDVPLNLDKEYHVAITLKNKTVSVYVGNIMISTKNITVRREFVINHFFIGGTGMSTKETNDNFCTVKNVMLFSRVLTENEIINLTKVKHNNEMNKQTTEANDEHEPESPAKTSIFTPSDATSGHKLTPDTKTAIAQGSDNTISATKFTKTTDNITSMQKKKQKESLSIIPENATNERDQKIKINNALHGSGDAIFEKYTNGDNAATLSLCTFVWICSVFSLILLMGF